MDLVARDHAGNAISDLKAEELRVAEDGKERPIKAFKLEQTASEERRRMHADVVNAVAKLPAGYSTNLKLLASAPDETACTVVVLDGLNTPFASRAFVRHEMLKLLANLQPQQPIAIYGLGNGLKVLQDFTTDPALLRTAAQKASTQGALQGAPEGDLIDHSASDAAPNSMTDDAYQALRSFEAESSVLQLDLRVQRTLDALDALARRLQSVPGRKNLIWLTSVFPLDLYPDGDFSSPSVRNYSDKLQATLINLENSRIAVYPVDANGLQVGPNANADRNPSGFSRRGPAAFADAQSNWSREINSTHDTMNVVAEKTGGRAYYNRNDLSRAIASALEDGSTYYSLAFEPQNAQADGKLHRIKVTTSHKGVKLNYRQAYLALDQQAPSGDRLKLQRQELSDALTEADHLSTGVILYAKLDPDGKSIDVIVDGHYLTFASSEGSRLRVQFQVATAVFDRKGKALGSGSEVMGTEFDTAKLEAFLRSGARYKAPLSRPDGAARVRIAVRDLASDRIGTVDVSLN